MTQRLAGRTAIITGGAGGIGGATGRVIDAADAVSDVGGGDEEMMDDLVSQMPIESYIACRVRFITDYLESRAILVAKRAPATIAAVPKAAPKAAPPPTASCCTIGLSQRCQVSG